MVAILRRKTYCLLVGLLGLLLFGCQPKSKQLPVVETPTKDTVLIDANYTFEQAIEGSKAPQSIIDQLTLITVHYYSMDGKIHQGQLLANKLIAEELREIFKEMLQLKFPIAKVIPAVKYNWNDEASMNDNNSYCFCYRDVSYSKHAQGMAIDINPWQNPNRWKEAYNYRKNKPEGAVYDPQAPGTLHDKHPVVALFKSKGYFWGRHFKRNFDDHHFEKKNY